MGNIISGETYTTTKTTTSTTTMNLNCLNCKFMHGNKSDSDCGEHDRDKSGKRLFNLKAEGISWSGNLYIPMSIPPPYKEMRRKGENSDYIPEYFSFAYLSSFLVNLLGFR